MSDLHVLSPIEPKPASGPGALDGFSSVCSCGLELSSSLESIVVADRRLHVEYHARRDAS